MHPMVSKIITPAGPFLASEVWAVSLLLHLFPDTPVERVEMPTHADFSDRSIVVVGFGSRYEPELNNYDNAEIPTPVLILNQFFEPMFPRLSPLLHQNFLDSMNGTRSAAEEPSAIETIIKTCNRLQEEEAFQTAVAIMNVLLQNQVDKAKRRIALEDIWKTVLIKNRVAVHHGPELIPDWTEIAEEAGVDFLITPAPMGGGYQLRSRDFNKFPILQDARQTFLHSTRFLATYRTLEDALFHASSL